MPRVRLIAGRGSDLDGNLRLLRSRGFTVDASPFDVPALRAPGERPPAALIIHLAGRARTGRDIAAGLKFARRGR